MVDSLEMLPQVTVICTCYNQSRFVVEAIRSVLDQTHHNIQLILIDNGSTDDSWQVINNFLEANKNFTFLNLPQNIGLCRAFNLGLAQATGKYVIDLAADDVMYIQKIEKQVIEFEILSDEYAVVFSNAQYIDEQGQPTEYHYAVDAQNRVVEKVPDGWVFEEVLKRYFICTPTMMMRRDVLERIGGYDESLAYEDFDFWVRTTREYKYRYLDAVLTQKRVVRGSMSTQFYQANNDLLRSSWVVCVKANDLANTPRERELLAGRIHAFIRKCVAVGNRKQAVKFVELLQKIQKPGWKTNFLVWASGLPLPINKFYRSYAWLRLFLNPKSNT